MFICPLRNCFQTQTQAIVIQVMEIELPKGKRYFKIGEVAKLFGLRASTLRHWEEEFKQLQPGKNRKGDRRYTPQDIHRVQQIYALLKEKGYTIPGAKEHLNGRGKQSKSTILKKLRRLKGIMQHIREELNQPSGPGQGVHTKE